ncbi:MAG: hydrogenase nickel incorporation protein HypB [bacterium]
MEEPQVVEINSKVLKANEEAAGENRKIFAGANLKGVFNLIGSPGAGKTSVLEQVVPHLETIGLIEGDIATSRDAQRVAKLGARTVQINTSGACHLDARMVSEVFPDFSLEGIEYLFIENVGNLVCPTGYDLGEDHKIVVISLPEGEDKAAKYPAIFRKSSLCVLNKVDLAAACEIDIERMKGDIRSVNPDLKIQEVSCKTGEGINELVERFKKLGSGEN